MAVASAVLQRDAPLPPRLSRGGAGVRRQQARILTGNRQRPVAGQPMAPVLIAGLQRALDQEPAKARAVDIEGAAQFAAIFQFQGPDIAGLAVQGHIRDLALHPGHAQAFGVPAQVGGVEPGVEMEGVVQPAQGCALDLRHATEPARHRHVMVETVIPQRPAPTLQHVVEPVVVERDVAEVFADGAEGVHVAVTFAPPVHELDAELEGGLGLADELVLIDPQHVIEEHDGGDGRLAHADRADILGLDQGDLHPRSHHLGQSRRGHPARRAAADDGDRLQFRRMHGLHPLKAREISADMTKTPAERNPAGVNVKGS